MQNRTPAEHRKFLEEQENRVNKIQPLDLNERLVHVHSRLRKAMVTRGIEVPHLVKEKGYAPISNIEDWVRRTGVKNEGDPPMSL
jgi:hypothetical protein